jgi:GDP-4-dehydro-6-deoxy-D-mannose reductase
VKVLVTGADGFVGRFVVRRLLDDGREVFAAMRPAATPPDKDFTPEERAAVRWVPLELTDGESVRRCAGQPYDAVIHLAAVASGAEAQRDPGYAWTVNAAGTARLVDALAQGRRDGRGDPMVLVVSTGEVYGRGDGTPRRETDAPAPCSPYAASKLGAEIAALEAWRRAGLRVVIARTFAHTGPGQDARFVVPAFAQRLKFARKIGAPVVKVGNLEPVREFLHVQDAVEAYARLLSKAEPGGVYNVASGQGTKLEDLLYRMASIVGVRPIVEADPELMRPADIPYLVGDATKVRSATGWTPRHSLDDILKQVLDATPD